MAYVSPSVESEVQGDLRETIIEDVDAQVLLFWQGNILVGSRNTINNGSEFDSGGGWTIQTLTFSAIFCLDDFNNYPAGSEIVTVRLPGANMAPIQRRILTTSIDQLQGGITLNFVPIQQI